MPAGLDGNPEPLVTERRSAVIARVVEQILKHRLDSRPLLVAVDGIDGSGKSTFADELATAITSDDHPTIRASIDSFHQPRTVRWRRGKTSPAGFYFDSHDHDAVIDSLLDPLRRGTGSYLTCVFDEPSDQPVHETPRPVDPRSILLFDGIFALRPELAQYWDVTIFLDGQQRVDLRRLGLVLNDLPSDPLDVLDHVLMWERRIDRYSSGMALYLDLVRPTEIANIVIDNNDLANPKIVTLR